MCTQQLFKRLYFCFPQTKVCRAQEGHKHVLVEKMTAAGLIDPTSQREDNTAPVRCQLTGKPQACFLDTGYCFGESSPLVNLVQVCELRYLTRTVSNPEFSRNSGTQTLSFHDKQAPYALRQTAEQPQGEPFPGETAHLPPPEQRVPLFRHEPTGLSARSAGLQHLGVNSNIF